MILDILLTDNTRATSFGQYISTNATTMREGFVVVLWDWDCWFRFHLFRLSSYDVCPIHLNILRPFSFTHPMIATEEYNTMLGLGTLLGVGST